MMARIRIEMDVWCSDPREFDNLITKINNGHVMEGDNGRHGGYGYEIKVQNIDPDKIRKALGFKKSEVTS
jgi:hypothetical protein